MADRVLRVVILGDDKDLQRALTRSSKSAQQFQGQFVGIGRTVGRAFAATGIALGGAALTRQIFDSIGAASDLNEEVSKSQQVFGDSSRAIERWSEQTASAIGVSQQEALAAAGTFGNLFKVVGEGQAEAAGMSRELVQLAADMASFNNANISDVLLAIRSGLIGEAEPLRRYGVLLSETRVQQAAMAATGKTNVKELTNQEKALARYNIILEDTATQQGDFARTSEGLANQSRILRARLADLNAEMGEKLLPIAVKTVSAFNDLFDAFTRAGTTLSPLGQQIIDENNIQGLIDMRDRLAEVKGEGDKVVQVLDQIIERMQDLEPLRPDDRGGIRGPGAIAASNRRVDAQEADAAAARARRELERSRRRFASFLKGQELRLDQAGLTKSLNDDLEVLRFIERAIQRRIAQEGRTYKLAQALIDVRRQIMGVLEQQAAEQDRREADQARNEEQRRQRRRQRAEQARIDLAERRQGDQFAALGLTREGTQRIPSVAALRRRLGSLRDQVEGTLLDTPRTNRQLDRIGRVLSGKFGAVGRDVRSAILQMFQDINSALREGTNKLEGPLTAFQKTGSRKLTEGLGISPEDRRELRFRLAQVGMGGTVPQRALGGGTIILNGDIVVEGGNPDAFMRAVQAKVRKRAATRTGRRRGSRSGMN